MGLKVLLGWLALNLGLLAAIWLIVRCWLRTRPLTGAVLARRLMREGDADGQRPDFLMGEIAFLMRDMGDPAEGRLLAAVLSDWRGRGLLSCEMAPKKRLSGFGEDMQPTLALAAGPSALPGAEGALFALLESACDGTLQSSEAYNWARAHAAELRDALRRFEAEGRARLRTEGAVREQTRKGFLGTARQERLVYTPRGQRRALALRRWENHLLDAPGDCLPHAVLLGCGEPPQPLGRFCEWMIQGYAAGLKSSRP